MISVVLANYNGASYLGEAIESVLVQEHDDFELIVVDDGSTDDSRAVIERCAAAHPDRRLIPLHHAQNRGQAAAFNTGFDHAQGEVVCLMDSDDLWTPGKLQAVQHAFDQDPETALFQHNLYLIRDGKPTAERFRPTLVTGDGMRYCMETRSLGVFVPSAGLAFARAVLDRVLPIPEDFRLSADGYLTRTAMCHGLINATHRCYGYYRAHSDNGTFENSGYDAQAYIHRLLIPQLNAYYRRAGLPLRFPQARVERIVAGLMDISPRKLIRRFRRPGSPA